MTWSSQNRETPEPVANIALELTKYLELDVIIFRHRFTRNHLFMEIFRMPNSLMFLGLHMMPFDHPIFIFIVFRVKKEVATMLVKPNMTTRRLSKLIMDMRREERHALTRKTLPIVD